MKFNIEACRMGRPPIYETAEEMAVKIGEYFDEGCSTTKVDKFGEERDVCVPTFSGLAHYLGYAGREGLYKAKERGEEFLHTINTALNFIEQQYEENLHLGEATTGSIFVLKCRAGWIEEEKKPVESTSKELTFSVKRKK